MSRKTVGTLGRTLVASVAVLGVSMGPAAAATIHAAAGNPNVASQSGTFNVGSLGVSRAASGAGTWMIPLVFNTAGAKTITVKGRVMSGGSIVCQGLVLDNTGAVVSDSGVVTMPVTSTFTSLNLTLNTIPFGGTGVVGCSLNGVNLENLLGVDYPL